MSEDRNFNSGDSNLDPPSFRIPQQEEDNSRYELWSIRIPVSLDVNSLNGQTIHVETEKKIYEQGTVLGKFEDCDNEYAFVTGNKAEHEAMRVLQPVEDSDEDGEDTMMVPSKVKFSRQVNVVDATCTNDIPDTEIAPGRDVAPAPNDPVRHAYAPVAQKSGLKRRWMPPGVQLKAVDIDTSKRKANDETADKPARKRTKIDRPSAGDTKTLSSSAITFNMADERSNIPKDRRDNQDIQRPGETPLSETSKSKKKRKEQKKSEKKAKKESKKEKKNKKRKSEPRAS